MMTTTNTDDDIKLILMPITLNGTPKNLKSEELSCVLFKLQQASLYFVREVASYQNFPMRKVTRNY